MFQLVLCSILWGTGDNQHCNTYLHLTEYLSEHTKSKLFFRPNFLSYVLIRSRTQRIVYHLYFLWDCDGGVNVYSICVQAKKMVY